MSKLAIVLCAVLFVSAANGYLLSRALETGQQAINATIFEAEEKFEASREQADQVVGKFFSMWFLLRKKVLDEIVNVSRKITVDMHNLGDKARDLSYECIQMYGHLTDITDTAFSSTVECIADKLKPGSEYRKSIDKIVENVLASLTQIRETVQHCGDNVDAVCKAAEAKAIGISTEVIPELNGEITKLDLFLETVEPNIAYCATTKELTTFYNESSPIVVRVEKCIMEKNRSDKVST